MDEEKKTEPALTMQEVLAAIRKAFADDEDAADPPAPKPSPPKPPQDPQ